MDSWGMRLLGGGEGSKGDSGREYPEISQPLRPRVGGVSTSSGVPSVLGPVDTMAVDCPVC